MPKVHRTYRHTWYRRSKEITARDQQAMWNFSQVEGRSYSAIAEHFGVSYDYVKEVVETRPWCQTEAEKTVDYTWTLEEIRGTLDYIDDLKMSGYIKSI